MKINYQPWKIDFSEFEVSNTLEAKLKFFVKFAVLAPSSHNSQPWSFTIQENKIIVSPDFSRALPYSDKNHRELYISLGCAIENLRTAANYFGFKTVVDYNNLDKQVDAVITFEEYLEDFKSKDCSIFSVVERSTNRNAHITKNIELKFKEWLKTMETSESSIAMVEDSVSKKEIGILILAAMQDAMADRSFRNELAGYLKSNTTVATLGMPASGFGIPTPLSYLAAIMMRAVNMGKLTRKKDEKLLLQETEAFLIISTKIDSPIPWIQTGEIYERICLFGTQVGLSMHPWAAVIQIGDHYRKLQKILPTNFRPQFCCRIGYCRRNGIKSPRLASEKVIIQN